MKRQEEKEKLFFKWIAAVLWVFSIIRCEAQTMETLILNVLMEHLPLWIFYWKRNETLKFIFILGANEWFELGE